MLPLYKHMVPWSSSSFSAVLRNHVQVSDFCVHVSLNFSFQLYLHHLHTEESIWRYLSSNGFGLFNRGTRCQIEKGHTARVPASTIDGREKSRLKGHNLYRLYQKENLWTPSCTLRCDWNRNEEAKRTNFHDETSHWATFTNFPAFRLLLPISVLAYSHGELLDYSEDDVFLTTEPQDQPSHQIRPSGHQIRPSGHQTRPVGHKTRQTSNEQPRKLDQMVRPVVTLSLRSRGTTPIQQNHHESLKRNYPRS